MKNFFIFIIVCLLTIISYSSELPKTNNEIKISDVVGRIIYTGYDTNIINRLEKGFYIIDDGDNRIKFIK